MISHAQCAPYLSATLLKIENGPTVRVAQLREAMVELLPRVHQSRKDIGLRREVHKVVSPIFKDRTVDVAWLHYSEIRPPAWYSGGDLEEKRHHVVFLVKKADIIALIPSDPAFRASVVTEIRKRRSAPFDRLKVLTAKQINDAFVGNRVRTLWLSGTHRRSATKADSKILSGIELETALNPLEDQSYFFSSVRSTLDSAALATNAGSSAIVGANPRNGRIWLGPSRDWKSFIGRAENIIDSAARAIAKPSASASPLPVLAQAMEGIPDASAPYDMAIIVPESISAGAEDNDNDPWLHEFSDASRFEITARKDSPSFEAEILWGNESYGKIDYEFAIDAGSSLIVKASASGWKHDADHQDEIRKICENTDLLTVYYDTGHTFSRGLFYETKFRDARFLNWQWAPLTGFDVGTEKPTKGKRFMIEDIGTAKDVSLFGFVSKHWPNYLNGGSPSGWLVCDDGSMESADFIHFNDRTDPPRLTLIHVKGSGSAKGNRGISVSDYEVVVGQAVKNLRYLDRSHISEKLAANKDKKIGEAVWHDGKRLDDRKEILKILAKAGSNMTKTVCVFQPSARKRAVEEIAARIGCGDLDRPEVRRLRQLDALLLAARAECLGLGAEFQVIGEDDTTVSAANVRSRRPPNRGRSRA